MIHRNLRVLLSLSVLLMGPARALADTCSAVEALTTIEVSRPLSLAYIDEQTEYWSTSCSALTPTCIIFPTTADEVATVISILSQNNERFAIKSGGHSPNNYFASVSDGALISTQKLDQILLDPQTGLLRLGPGNRLHGVAAALDGTGWTFVGGRIGNTGVGGLVLGGGLSYMSAQYGWAASSVIEYEIVLANSTVTTASSTKNPSLFKALKGGGNNFGVVTSYLLQAHSQGDVWGGNVVYVRTPAIDEQLLRAVRDFTEYNTDDRAAVIVTAERTNADLVDTWILFLFYDGPTPPPGIFDNFTASSSGGILQPVTNTCRTRTYADLMASSNWVIVPLSNVQIGTETIPIPSDANADTVMQALHAHWRSVSSTALLVPGIVASIAFQPFPRRIAQAALDRGGDLIDCDAGVDRMIIEVNYHFLLASDYARMDGVMQQTYSGIRERVLAWEADGTLPADVHLPVFMNYGFYRQDYFGRLRPESRALARAVSADVDPKGLFRDRTGGWRP